MDPRIILKSLVFLFRIIEVPNKDIKSNIKFIIKIISKYTLICLHHINNNSLDMKNLSKKSYIFLNITIFL